MDGHLIEMKNEMNLVRFFLVKNEFVFFKKNKLLSIVSLIYV